MRLIMALTALVVCVYSGSPSRADTVAESDYDRLWRHRRLYEGSPESPFQSVDLSGRFQGEFASVDSDSDDHGEFNVRRFRFGVKTVFLRDVALHIEADFNPQEGDPLYLRLTNANLAWDATKAVTVTLGKHGAEFTLDGMTSSKRLITIDRNNLSQNLWFTEEYVPGISIEGETHNLIYDAGVFSSGNKDPEFGDFTGGQFFLVTVGHDFARGLGAKEALLRLNLVDNEPDPDNGFTRDLERIASLNWSYDAGSWGLRADASAAKGYFEQSDLWGFVLMPFFNLTEKLQLVGRYTLVESRDPNGVRLAGYESTIEKGKGDRYDELHFGINYYLYGHELKLQGGAQYVEMDDRANDGGEYRGWSATAGLRLSW